MLHEPRQRRSWLIFDVGQKVDDLGIDQSIDGNPSLHVPLATPGLLPMHSSPSDQIARLSRPNVRRGKIGAAEISKHTGKEGVGG
jgi:hypothetical protein